MVLSYLRLAVGIIKGISKVVKTGKLPPIVPVATLRTPVAFTQPTGSLLKGTYVRGAPYSPLPQSQRIILETAKIPLKSQIKTEALKYGALGALSVGATTAATGKLPQVNPKLLATLIPVGVGYKIGGIGGAVAVGVPVATAVLADKASSIPSDFNPLPKVFTSVEEALERGKARAQEDIDKLLKHKQELQDSISEIVARQNSEGVQWIGNRWESTEFLTQELKQKLKLLESQIEFVSSISKEQLMKLQEELIQHKIALAAAGLATAGVGGAVAAYKLIPPEQRAEFAEKVKAQGPKVYHLLTTKKKKKVSKKRKKMINFFLF